MEWDIVWNCELLSTRKMVIGEKIHFKPLKNVILHGYSIRPEKQVCLEK